MGLPPAIATRTCRRSIADRLGQGSLRDRDQGPDRRVGPDLGGFFERHLDAAEALRGAEGGAVEGVQGIAAVEVADPFDPRDLRSGSRRGWSRSSSFLRGARRPGRCRARFRHPGMPVLAACCEDLVAVVPERHRLGKRLAHVDVAVARFRLALAGDGGSQQRRPDLRAGFPVRFHFVFVLEGHHGAAGDRVRLACTPVRAQAGWGCPDSARRSCPPAVRPPPAPRRMACGHWGAGRLPFKRQVAGLGEELLEAQGRARRDRPADLAAGLEGAARLDDVDLAGKLGVAAWCRGRRHSRWA